MFTFIVNAIKIVFLLGFLVFIHESGHFVVAKLCKVKVKEFAIGFGPTIWKKQSKETKYALRLIPLGGFVNMLGEEEKVDEEGSFCKASILKRVLIVIAGGLVNIVFGILVYFIIASIMTNISYGFLNTGKFLTSIFESLKLLFSGQVGVNELAGPVGISNVVSNTRSFLEFWYILAIISVSLGVTNLLPFPPLDGGKIVLLLIEAIRKKPLKESIELGIQSIGFLLIIGLSIYVTYNDILKIR